MPEELKSPSGSKIENCEDLRREIAATKEDDIARKRFLVKKGIDIGCINDIPEHWEVDFENE